MEQLVRAVVVLCCGASSVYNTDEDGHSNGVTSASIQAARTAVPRRAGRRNPRVLWHRGTQNPKFSSPAAGHHFDSLLSDSLALSHAFIRHSPEDQSLLSLSWSVLIYAQICVLRALDVAKFSSPPAGPLAAGLERDFCRCRLEVLHLFENLTPPGVSRVRVSLATGLFIFRMM